VHFFNRDAFAAWEKWCGTASEGVRETLAVVTDFGIGEKGMEVEEVEGDGEKEEEVPWGTHALPLDYEPIKEYVAKGQDIFEFERQGSCIVCREDMQVGEGLQAVCSNSGCDGVGHLSCWSWHFNRHADGDDIVPVQGECPKCKGSVTWGEMMKELTLRVRGPKEVEKLLKRKRKRAAKKQTKS
jgi:structure-specific endonuclease subunit SLX1